METIIETFETMTQRLQEAAPGKTIDKVPEDIAERIILETLQAAMDECRKSADG